MSSQNSFDDRDRPKSGEARKLLIISVTLMVTLPGLLVAALIFLMNATRKPEIQSLEMAIKSVGVEIKEKDDCKDNVQGYYEFRQEQGEVTSDEIVVCTNNFSYNPFDYAALLKHEMTHIMHACLGTTINSPDEIRQLRAELKKKNESSYRTIHGMYAENNHFMEVEARWMELQRHTYVNNQLQKHCG